MCQVRALLTFTVVLMTLSITSGQTDSATALQHGASAYVPLDSWVYPVIERLQALGYAPSAFLGMRPWTRADCARLARQVGELINEDERAPGEARSLSAVLDSEFTDSARRFSYAVESIYSRQQGILGPPLRDGYHFGQSLTNDYGRPYAEGGNFVSGVSVRGGAGAFVFHVQGELQQWPSTTPATTPVVLAIADADNRPPLAESGSGAHRFRLLDTYVALQFRKIQLSFGKQSLWLGPGQSGPFLFSNNAEPIWMLQFNRTAPWRIPWIARLLGPMRWQFFLGQLRGHGFVFSAPTLFGPSIDPQPYIHGEKVSFHPTKNLEFGMGVTTVFGGPGMPFTARTFVRSLSWWNHNAGTSADAGDHRSSFDFSYRIPGVRSWLVIYGDALVEDEISPIGSSRPAFHPGIYLPRIPHLPKLDMRLEGMYTDVPGQRPIATIYYNSRYRSGYTNYGNVLGSWIGRQGRGGQGWLTYWFAARNRLQLVYRHSEADRKFLQGGHLNDVGVSYESKVKRDFIASWTLQYERWAFPLLATGARSNITIGFQLTFTPGD